MNKFMFSAIAMIAFVGSSMASEIAEEEVGTVDCGAVAMAALDAADPNRTMTQNQMNDFYQGQYDACIKSTNKLIHAGNK